MSNVTCNLVQTFKRRINITLSCDTCSANQMKFPTLKFDVNVDARKDRASIPPCFLSLTAPLSLVGARYIARNKVKSSGERIMGKEIWKGRRERGKSGRLLWNDKHSFCVYLKRMCVSYMWACVSAWWNGWTIKCEGNEGKKSINERAAWYECVCACVCACLHVSNKILEQFSHTRRPR